MPSSLGPLAAQFARGTGAVFLARDDDERSALGLIAHGRVVNRHNGPSGRWRVIPPPTGTISFLSRMLRRSRAIITRDCRVGRLELNLHRARHGR